MGLSEYARTHGEPEETLPKGVEEALCNGTGCRDSNGKPTIALGCKGSATRTTAKLAIWGPAEKSQKTTSGFRASTDRNFLIAAILRAKIGT